MKRVAIAAMVAGTIFVCGTAQAQNTRKPGQSPVAPQDAAPTHSALVVPARRSAPIGNAHLVDHAIASDKIDGFFQLYVQQIDPLERGVRWSFQPLVADRMLGSGARAFPAAGAWSRWAADCNGKRLTITDIVWVAQDGRTLPTGPGPAPRLDPASGWTRPAVLPAAAIQNDLCPPDLQAVMLGSIKSGFNPRQFASAGQVIVQARQVRTPSPDIRNRSTQCEVLAQEADRISNSALLRNASVGGSFAAKRLTLQNLAKVAATGRSQPELEAARAEAKSLVDRALASKSAAELARELDKCLTDLPLGALPGAFAVLLR